LDKDERLGELPFCPSFTPKNKGFLGRMKEVISERSQEKGFQRGCPEGH
jgi:hypothetical protein